MIRMTDVSKVYRTKTKTKWWKKVTQEKVAVDRLSLEIQPGEIVGLLGLNGAGKTTTIKMLSTLLAPTSGTITIDGLDLEKERREVQKIVNMIAGGERMLYWRLTGRENLYYFGRLYGLPESDLARRSLELLAEVGLVEAADVPVEQYSKGMKQRLQIARGLINDPKYLFLDEPTLGLDAPIARQLRKMVRAQATEQGKGILLTSHYLQEVEELCDRVYVLDRGKLILCDTTETVVRHAAGQQQLHILLGGWRPGAVTQLIHHFDLLPEAVACVEAPDADGHRLTIQTESTDQLLPRLLPWLLGQGFQVLQMSAEKPTLEDAIVLLAEGGRTDGNVLARVSS